MVGTESVVETDPGPGGGGGLAGGFAALDDGLVRLVCISFIKSSFSVFLANTKSVTLF